MQPTPRIIICGECISSKGFLSDNFSLSNAGQTVSASQFEQFLFRKWLLHQNRTDRQHPKKKAASLMPGQAAFLKNTI
jgi:hypothetical protein